MNEYSICTVEPWVCNSLPRLILEHHWKLLLLFVVLSAVVAFLTVIAIPFLKNQKRKHHPIVAFFAIFIFLLLTPAIVLQLGFANQHIKVTSNLVKCMALKANNQCFVFAAVTAIEQTETTTNYSNSMAICDTTAFPEKCKVTVCDSLQIHGAVTPEKTQQLKEKKMACWEEAAPVCPNGIILENIPCGCYSPELSRYAVHTVFWLEEYWNKYRQMDPKPYCCDGEKSSGWCKL